MHREIRSFFGPPRRTVRARPSLTQFLSDPALQQASHFLAMDLGIDIKQHMHMIRSRGAGAQFPAAALANRRNDGLNESLLLLSQGDRWKLHAIPCGLFAPRVFLQEFFSRLIVRLVHGRPIIAMNSRAIRSPGNMPRCQMWMELLHDSSTVVIRSSADGGEDAPARA